MIIILYFISYRIVSDNRFNDNHVNIRNTFELNPRARLLNGFVLSEKIKMV